MALPVCVVADIAKANSCEGRFMIDTRKMKGKKNGNS
jgi:hypothetical protein